jgi:hypothetical protein
MTDVKLILAGMVLFVAGDVVGAANYALGVDVAIGLLAWIVYIIARDDVEAELDRGRQARHVLRVVEHTLRRRADELVDPLDDATLVDVFNAIRRAKKENPVIDPDRRAHR